MDSVSGAFAGKGACGLIDEAGMPVSEPQASRYPMSAGKCCQKGIPCGYEKLCVFLSRQLRS